LCAFVAKSEICTFSGVKLSIIGKNIDIGLRHPQIIGDLKKLSAKLSISKLTAKLSKNYRYRKI